MSADNNLETMIRARVSEEQKRQLEAIAAERQMPASAIIREAIREYLAAHYTGQTRPDPEPRPEPEPPTRPEPPPGPTPPRPEPTATQPKTELVGCV